MNEQQISYIRQQLRQEIARTSASENFSNHQASTQIDPQINTQATNQVDAQARQFFSGNFSNFSTSLPNLNVDSLIENSNARNSQQPWTTDDLVEAEKFYNEINSLSFEPAILSPNSHGRHAPLPRAESFYLPDSPQLSPLDRQILSLDLHENPDLGERIDFRNLELSGQVSMADDPARSFSPDSDQSTRSSSSLKFPQTNSPDGYGGTYRQNQTPFASPTPSSPSSPNLSRSNSLSDLSKALNSQGR